MKKKDLLYLTLAAVILLVAGYLAYTQLLPDQSKGNKDVVVETVGPITDSFDEDTLAELSDPAKTRNFNVPIDLSTGLGNTAPFGQ